MVPLQTLTLFLKTLPSTGILSQKIHTFWYLWLSIPLWLSGLCNAQPEPLSTAALAQRLTVFSLAIHPFELIFEFSKKLKSSLKTVDCFTYSLKLFCPLLPLGFFSFLFLQTFLSTFYSCTVFVLYHPCHFSLHLWCLYWTVTVETICFQNHLVLCYCKETSLKVSLRI